MRLSVVSLENGVLVVRVPKKFELQNLKGLLLNDSWYGSDLKEP